MTTDNAFNEKDISKIIDENIVIVLERFNCCTCDVCKDRITSYNVCYTKLLRGCT